jgi:hypothetical protein
VLSEACEENIGSGMWNTRDLNCLPMPDLPSLALCGNNENIIRNFSKMELMRIDLSDSNSLLAQGLYPVSIQIH